MSSLLQDLHFALRTMRRNPGLTFLAVMTMTLGIGANTAVFSLVDGVLLHPLDYPHPERLCSVRLGSSSKGSGPLSIADYLTLSRSAASFEGFSIYTATGFALATDGGAEAVAAAVTDADFFETLGIRPVLGRAFLPGEDQIGKNRVALLTDTLWRNRFAADPHVLGRVIQLDAQSYRVIGVLPAGFRFPGHSNPMIVVPLEIEPPSRRGPFYVNGVARLKPGVETRSMQAELEALANRIQAQYSSDAPDWRFQAIPLRERLVGHTRSTLNLLLGAVALVLLIACVNVANLLLSRSAGRMREMAVRTGLGASGGRLLRQLLTESLLLSLVGGVAGVGLAWLILAVLPTSQFLLGFAGLRSIELNGQVLALTLAVTLLCGILFGLAPALQTARRDLARTINESGRGASSSKAGNRLRSTLVVAEFALALMLLVGAGLLIRSALNIRRADPGFNPRHLLTALVSVPGGGSRLFAEPAGEEVETQRRQFFQRLVEEVRALPGVAAAGLASGLPPKEYWFSNDFIIRERPLESGQSPFVEICNVVDPPYFEALGVNLLQGRNFKSFGESADVSIVDEAFVKKYFPDGIGVGKHIRWTGAGDLAGSGEDSSWSEIVGVVGNVRYDGLDEDFQPTWYMPRLEFSPPPTFGYLVVRTQVEPTTLIPSVRRVVAELNPQAPLDKVATMEERIRRSVAEPRFRALLMLVFAAAALLLAAVGIYGVISYGVMQRRKEMSIRMALGAGRREVFRQVLVGGLRLAGIGLVLGLAASLALSRMLAGLLHDVSPLDPATFLAVSAGLLAVAVAACVWPTLRATRIDPVAALRQE